MELRERVAYERMVRGAMSARTAAKLGDIANTTWSTFEKTGVVTDGIRAAVAQAFGWPMDWPESPPEVVSLRSDEADLLRAEIADLRARMDLMVDPDGAEEITRLAQEMFEALSLSVERIHQETQTELIAVRGRLAALEARGPATGDAPPQAR